MLETDLGVIVYNGVCKDIEAGRSREYEGSPPPVIVLTTQLKVCHDNSHFRTGNNKNDKDKEQKAEKIIELVLPDSLYNGRSNMSQNGGRAGGLTDSIKNSSTNTAPNGRIPEIAELQKVRTSLFPRKVKQYINNHSVHYLEHHRHSNQAHLEI